MQKYQYIKIDGRYYCQQQSLLKLARLFLFSRESCPEFIDWKLLPRLLLNKIAAIIRSNKLELPVFGVWGLRVHSGYKIFDPYKRTATKIFDDDIDFDLVRKEIAQHVDIGSYDFAPKIQDWSEAERWYREEYLSGESSYYFSPDVPKEFMRIYYSDVAPCIVELMNLTKHRTITIKEYVDAKKTEINNQLDLMGREEPEIAKSVREFYEYTYNKLTEEADEEIYLVFSHGDFHLFNLFKTKSGIKLIDWEGAGEGSLTHDFFNYFFSHLWLDRTKGDYVEEVMQAINDMKNRLAENNAELAQSLADKWRLYLLLYYYERIYAALIIFKSPPEYLLVWIDLYRKFEERRAHLIESDMPI